MRLYIGLWIGALVVALLLCSSTAIAQAPHHKPTTTTVQANIGSAFNFQGVLRNDNGEINGVCDFKFALYPTLNGGNPIGSDLFRTNLQVTGGYVAVSLDFGNVFTGDPRWLETAVRCPAGNGSFVPLSPRQLIQPAPYAITAVAASQSNGDFTVNGNLTASKTGIFGGAGTQGGIILKSPDFSIQADNSFNRGDGGRALVQENGDLLVINYAKDFSGGVQIDSDALITGGLTIEGPSIRLLGADLYINAGGNRGDGGRALVHTVNDTLAINYDGDFAGGVTINNLHTGKVVEENLLTPQQQQAAVLAPFSLGDVLCWDGATLALAFCREQASPLIVAVADAQGKPIVMGAEPVKVIGVVAPGDLLVAASQPGYAVAWSQLGQPGGPPIGITIAKALEPSHTKQGMIKALIMLR
ncbi:MAG: hypothetical protein U0350_00335 [Caldilineaceae bacterium]